MEEDLRNFTDHDDLINKTLAFTLVSSVQMLAAGRRFIMSMQGNGDVKSVVLKVFFERD